MDNPFNLSVDDRSELRLKSFTKGIFLYFLFCLLYDFKSEFDKSNERKKRSHESFQLRENNRERVLTQKRKELPLEPLADYPENVQKLV
jgi:hypothetical protein